MSELQRRISRRKVVREGAFVEAVGQASCEPFRASDCETGGGSKGGGVRADNKQGGKVITLHLAGGYSGVRKRLRVTRRYVLISWGPCQFLDLAKISPIAAHPMV